MENSNKVVGFLKSLFMPRQMAKHMNMRFLVSLLLLMVASCLNIVTSNTRASKDAEEMLAFPSAFDEIPADFKVTELGNGAAFPSISINYTSDVKVNVIVDGKEQEVTAPYPHLTADKNGVYYNNYTKGEKSVEVTIVVADTVYSSYGTIDSPISIDFFDLEGYLKQEKKENTEYLLYVFTLDSFYYLFGLEQVDENGASTKAVTNSLVFECTDSGDFKYYLPANESELTLNNYGNFDTTKWTKEVSVDDQLNFSASQTHYDELVASGVTISYEQYKTMVSRIVPENRHLKNLSNALYGDTVFYSNLETEGFKFEDINTSIAKFQKDFKVAMIDFNAGMIKTSSLFVSAFITLLFPLFLAGVTWLLSKNFYMNKFRQYYAIAALCFSMTTIIALIAGFFVSYTNMAFALLVIASVYYIIVTFRINTIPKEEDNNGDNPKPETKEPIKYNKLSDDTSIIG